MKTVGSIGIIGFGDFGTFLAELAQTHAPDVVVKIYSSSRAIDGRTFFSLDEVCDADLVIPCVPIHAFAQTIADIAPLLGPHTIICDIATVKEYTLNILKSNQIPRYISSHPMFGPFSYEKRGHSLHGLRIAICDTTLSDTDETALISFLETLGLIVLTLSASEHDKQIAETLFLTHLLGQIIKTGAFTRTSIDTASFGYLMDATESVSHDTELFHDVFRYNRYCKEVLERFRKAQQKILDILNE